MVKLLKQSDYQKMPWKNGRGTTSEIAISNPGPEFDWRLSMAEIVESGPFSSFNGMDRILTLLEGPEIQIMHQESGGEKTLPLYWPYHFSGDWKTEAIVSGKGRDLNFIYRRDKFIGSMKLENSPVPESRLIHEKGLCAIFCLSGMIVTEYGELTLYDTIILEEEKIQIDVSAHTSFLFLQLKNRI